MAVGDVTYKNNLKKCICLMTGQTSANAVPAAATDGVACYPENQTDIRSAFFPGDCPEASTLLIHNTAGSGVITGTFVLWGYCAAANKWYPMNVNGGAAIAEVASIADAIRHAEEFARLGRFDRLYLQLSALAGTAPAFEAYLVTARKTVR